MKKRLFRFAKPYTVQEKLILRDHLALERTRLANERTLLTYIRSALYLIIAGIAFLHVEEFEQIPYLGVLCFVVSGVLALIGIVRYWQLRKEINRMYKEATTE